MKLSFVIPTGATDTSMVICTTDTVFATALIKQGHYRAATREESLEAKALQEWIPKGARTAGK